MMIHLSYVTRVDYLPERTETDEALREVLERHCLRDQFVDLVVHIQHDCRLEISTCVHGVSRGREGGGRRGRTSEFLLYSFDDYESSGIDLIHCFLCSPHHSQYEDVCRKSKRGTDHHGNSSRLPSASSHLPAPYLPPPSYPRPVAHPERASS
jgi:hypothetical protein